MQGFRSVGVCLVPDGGPHAIQFRSFLALAVMVVRPFSDVPDDEATAALLDKLMASASGPTGADQPVDTKIRPMLDGLPVAGGTGTLADRFTVGENPGAGWVRAKTGTLTGVSSLTGIVQTVDGRVLSFALISGGTSPADARPALDAVAGKLRECGCR